MEYHQIHLLIDVKRLCHTLSTYDIWAKYNMLSVVVVVGCCWLLVVGCWLLVVGFVVVGCWLFSQQVRGGTNASPESCSPSEPSDVSTLRPGAMPQAGIARWLAKPFRGNPFLKMYLFFNGQREILGAGNLHTNYQFIDWPGINFMRRGWCIFRTRYGRLLELQLQSFFAADRIWQIGRTAQLGLESYMAGLQFTIFDEM